MATAYGFLGMTDLFNQRVSQVGVRRVWDAIAESAAIHSRQIDEMLGGLVVPTESALEQFELPGDGILQPLDEWGNPLPVQPSGNYQVAFPIKGGGTAWGTNRVSAALMTVEEANRFTVDAQVKDRTWMRQHMIASLLDSQPWTYNDRIGPNGSAGLGNVTVQPLANGDAVTYVRRDGSSSTDTHYLAQAVGIDDANNPFPTIYTELMEHPSNAGGEVVAYVASSLVTSIKALANFVEARDQDVQPGNASDSLVGSISRSFGEEVHGKVDKVWIVEWMALPAGYILAHARGGGQVLKMRQFPAPELRGFFPEEFKPDAGRVIQNLIRYCGFGVFNRVGALAYYVGNAAYQDPAGFEAQLGAL